MSTEDDILPVIAFLALVDIHFVGLSEIGRIAIACACAFGADALVVGPYEVVGLEHVDFVGEFGGLHISVDRHLYLALVGLLGGDEHNTVGASRTIDSCRRGILKHLDILDIGSGHIVERAFKTVDKHKWLVALGKRAAATHTHGNLGVGRTVGCCNLHTGHTSYNSLADIGYRHALDSLGVDRSH